MEVNFVTQINAFERWCETNPLPALSQLLWYKFFALFNKSGWIEWVTVDNLRLMALINVRREATFIELRNNLINANLLCYKKGKKGSPNKYKLNYFTFTDEVQTVVQAEVQTVVQTEVQTADINKLNKTKQNIPAPKAQKKIFEDESEAMKLAKLLYSDILKNNEQAKEPNLQKWAAEFDIIMRLDKREYKALRYMIHFAQADIKFWYKVILSPDNLRKNYDRLLLAVREANEKR